METNIFKNLIEVTREALIYLEMLGRGDGTTALRLRSAVKMAESLMEAPK